MQFDIDMESEHKALFEQARKHLLSFEGFVETKKMRITTYSNDKGGICHMRTMKYGIDIGFLKGAIMDDKFGLLTGDGKVMRVLPLELFDIEQVDYYINQAIEINVL